MHDNGLPKLNPLSVVTARKILEDVDNFLEYHEYDVSSFIIDEDAAKLVELMYDLSDNVRKTIKNYEQQQINLSRRG